MRTNLDRHARLVAEVLGEVRPGALQISQAMRQKMTRLTENLSLLRDNQPKISTDFVDKFSKALNANLFGEDATDLRAEVLTAGGAGKNFDGFVEVYKRGVVLATYKFLVTHDENFQGKENMDTFYIPSKSFTKGGTEFYLSPEILDHMIDVAKNSLKIKLAEQGVEVLEGPEKKHSRGKRHIVGVDHQLHRMV